MATFLFDKIIFGPIQSRRLGVSLGINLLPLDRKICSFDCIYCECGYNSKDKALIKFPLAEEVKESLEKQLQQMKNSEAKLDVITFAGNGEPTLHPDFEKIIEDTLVLRDKYYPNAKVSVLSNATQIGKSSVFRALNKVDNNILKLDSAITETLKKIDQPNSSFFTVDKLVDELKKFNGNLIIQTLFLKGSHNENGIDNTTSKEIDAWLSIIKDIQPKQVMIYTIDRDTPEKNLEKISKEELEKIADKVRLLNIDVSVSA